MDELTPLTKDDLDRLYVNTRQYVNPDCERYIFCPCCPECQSPYLLIHYYAPDSYLELCCDRCNGIVMRIQLK